LAYKEEYSDRLYTIPVNRRVAVSLYAVSKAPSYWVVIYLISLRIAPLQNQNTVVHKPAFVRQGKPFASVLVGYVDFPYPASIKIFILGSDISQDIVFGLLVPDWYKPRRFYSTKR